MQKFRSHKSRLIHSKRDSQKIDHLELLTLNSEQHSKKNCFNFTGLINQKLHTITDKHYKIDEAYDLPIENSIPQVLQFIVPQDKFEETTLIEESKQIFQPNDTFKTDKTSTSAGSENQLLQNILSLMKTINTLQQKSTPTSKANESLKNEIKEKMTEFKQLMSQFQNSFLTNIFDFYNEDHEPEGSPTTSLNNRTSQQVSPQNTDRVAYEMQQRQTDKKFDEIEIQNHNQIETKCHRATESTQSLDTFSEDAFKDYYSAQNQLFFSIGQEKEEEKELQQEEEYNQDKDLNESSIIHLFSYQKQKTIESALPSITQRSSEHCSQDTKYPANQLFTESVQYKKIFYLLQTTEKNNPPNNINKQEISEIQLSNRMNSSNSNSKNINPTQSDDKSRNHIQFKGMINRFQTKCKRSVKKQAEVTTKPKYPVLNSKGFKQRRQR